MRLLSSVAALSLAAAVTGCASTPAAPRAASDACSSAPIEGLCIWPNGLEPAVSPVYVYNEATIPAPPQVVWDHLTRPLECPAWFSQAKNVRIEAGPPVIGAGSVVVWEMLGATIRVKVERAEAGKLLAWEGGATGVHAYHAWILVPAGKGTRVVTVETENGAVPGLLAPYLRSALHEAHAEWLRGLGEVAQNRR